MRVWTWEFNLETRRVHISVEEDELRWKKKVFWAYRPKVSGSCWILLVLVKSCKPGLSFKTLRPYKLRITNPNPIP